MHICVGNLTILGSDNGLVPDRRQAIIWMNAEILSLGPLWTNVSELLVEIHTFSFNKTHSKMLSAKWRLFCQGLNMLTNISSRGYCYKIRKSIHICWGATTVSFCSIVPKLTQYQQCHRRGNTGDTSQEAQSTEHGNVCRKRHDNGYHRVHNLKHSNCLETSKPVKIFENQQYR